MAEVNRTLEEGFQSLEALYQKGIGAVESVKFIAITLRKLPTVDIGTPTVRIFLHYKAFRLFHFLRWTRRAGNKYRCHALV